MGARSPRMVAASNYAKSLELLDSLKSQYERAAQRASELSVAVADQEKVVADCDKFLRDAASTPALSTP